jgi:hypothetical protein
LYAHVETGIRLTASSTARSSTGAMSRLRLRSLTQRGAHVLGHVFCEGEGVMHCLETLAPPSVTQQICPGEQQALPQHVCDAPQAVTPSQMGARQVPASQDGVTPPQTFPQRPQLKGSLCVDTHAPPQHTSAAMHGPAHAPPLLESGVLESPVALPS